MELSGVQALSSINSLSKPEVGLRPFQRVTAQVLDVTGTTALLSIDGIPIVAQLTSSEQAATLLSQQTVQFIVTQLTNQKVTLKILKNDSTQTPINSIPPAPELAARLLEQNNIPITVNHLMMARSILKQHLPITDELLNEIMEALSGYGVWGSREAEAAVALKAAGLPVSAESISLASRQSTKISESIPELIRWLNNLASPDLPAEVLKQLELNMWLLNGMVLNGDEEPSRLAEQLRTVLSTLGRSLENILLQGSQNPDSNSSEIGLLSLARLQKILTHSGKNEAAESVGKFLEDIRSIQLFSTKSEWAQVAFSIQNAKIDREFSTARLRVARDTKSNTKQIDPSSTRIILQVDVNPSETIEVDLDIIGNQIRTLVTSPNPAWCQQAQSEMPSLEESLQGLGFTLKDSKVCTGQVQPTGAQSTASDNESLMAVDIEV